MTEGEERKPWEQEEGEPTEAFTRFARYFLPLGAHRSLLAAYNAWRREKGRGNATSTPRTWPRYAQKWHWQERAEAWDLDQVERFRREIEEQRRQNRLDSIAALRAGRAKVMEGILASKATGTSIDKLIKALAEVEEQLRIAYGDVGRRDELRVQDEAVVKGYGGGFTPDDWPDDSEGD